MSRADDRRKARELQTALVQDISQTVARAVGTGQLLATGTIHKQGANGTAVFNETLLEWKTSRASLDARLRAYFAHASLDGQSVPRAWDAFARGTEDLYYLATTELPHRCRVARDLAAYLAPGTTAPDCLNTHWAAAVWAAKCAHAKTDWDALSLCDEDTLKKQGEGYVRGQRYFDAYTAASAMISNREDRILNAVRTASPAGF